jgi:alpha-tubulin suppressor-like RCC1 family protein
VAHLDAVTSIAAGDEHSLALRSDGTVWAWGANASGQLGDGTTDRRTQPARVEALDNVRGIAAGHAFSLALKADGSVWAWGANEAGQLGDGTNNSSLQPVRVRDLDGVEAIAAGAYFSLARKSDGSVWAWGANEYGQVGQGAPSDGSNAPVPVAGLTGATSIAAGGYHALALDASGAAWAWGANWFGELGTPTTEQCEHGGQPQPCSSAPRQVQGISVPLVRLAGGEFHSLGLGSDGSVWAWGLNADGELRAGLQHPSAPVRVGGLAGEVSIAAGGLHSLAAAPAGSAQGGRP